MPNRGLLDNGRQKIFVAQTVQKMKWQTNPEAVQRKIGIILAIVAVIILIFLAFRFAEDEKYRIEVKENKFHFFNDGKPPLKIVQLSDFQSAHQKKEYVQKIVSIANAQNADIILITGDIVEGYENPAIVEDLAGLHAKSGVYAILGNHDYRTWWDCPPSKENVQYTQELSQNLKRAGIILMRNENVIVNISGREVFIVGLDDASVCADDYAASVLQTQQRDKIVMLHEPARAGSISFEGKNFVLSGHTHCGQVYIPYLSEFLLGVFGYGDDAGGYAQLGGQNLQYISCGLDPGKIRLFNPNSIEVLYID